MHDAGGDGSRQHRRRNASHRIGVTEQHRIEPPDELLERFMFAQEAHDHRIELRHAHHVAAGDSALLPIG